MYVFGCIAFPVLDICFDARLNIKSMHGSTSAVIAQKDPAIKNVQFEYYDDCDRLSEHYVR